MKNREVKPSDILREAAECIEKEKYRGCCAAILYGKSGGNDTQRGRAYELFSSLFKPSGMSAKSFWFHSNNTIIEPSDKEKQHRVISLLLTADMAESVGE